MYLLDTHVVSEIRRPRPHSAVSAWLTGLSAAEIHISAVTIGELQAGVELTRVQDRARAAELEAWIDQVAASYDILAMDAAIFRTSARLLHGRSDDLFEDAMIAATAIVHGLIVATRNVRDFAHFGVPIFDPFKGVPPARR